MDLGRCAVAIVIWVVASVAFAFYVGNFGSYDKTYGSLAGVIVALLWLWIANIALLFGAELDSELERGRELQGGNRRRAGAAAPARDTRNSEKARKKEHQDIERGRRIREAADMADGGRPLRAHRGRDSETTSTSSLTMMGRVPGDGTADGDRNEKRTPYAVSCRNRVRRPDPRAVRPRCRPQAAAASRGPLMAVGATGAVVGAAVWRLYPPRLGLSP